MKEGTIFLVTAFPTPWPPARDILLCSTQRAESLIRLSADSTGRLAFSRRSLDGTNQRATFQPLVIAGSGRAVVAARWSDNDTSLWVNGVRLQLDTSEGMTVVLQTSSERKKPRPFFFLGLQPGIGNSEAERLFLGVVVDIDSKVADGSRYNIIKAAGLLRQLFLDPTPLIHFVNRTFRLKLEFECIESCSDLLVSPDADWQNPDPSFFPGAATTKVDLSGFMKVPCLSEGDRTASVVDVIRVCANAKGGIHFGQAKSTEEDLILDWDKWMILEGKEPSLVTIAGICRVALIGLQPLVQAISGQSASKHLNV